MNINYRIVEIWTDDHLIVVRYYTDVISEEELRVDANNKEDGSPYRCKTDVSIDVPIPEPDEKDLHKFILSHAPIAFLEKLEAIKNPKVNTKMTKIKKLFGKVNSVSDEELKKITTPTPPPTIGEQELKKLLKELE